MVVEYTGVCHACERSLMATAWCPMHACVRYGTALPVVVGVEMGQDPESVTVLHPGSLRPKAVHRKPAGSEDKMLHPGLDTKQ